MRIPANIIKYNYTIGNEYIYASSYKYYQGYYYEINNKFFAGREFNINSPELIKANVQNTNLLLTQANTYVFGLISKIKFSQLQTPTIKNLSVNKSDETNIFTENDVFFYCKKNNVNPITIKNINEKTYNDLLKNPIYQVIFIGTYKGINITNEQAYKQMPGLKAFLEG